MAWLERSFLKLSRPGNDACHCGRSGNPGIGEINFRLQTAHPPFEVAVSGGDGAFAVTEDAHVSPQAGATGGRADDAPRIGEDLEQLPNIAPTMAPRLDDAFAQEVPSHATGPAGGGGGGAPASSTWAQGDAVVADPVGLHARPAAAFVRLAGTFDAEVTVNGADGGSVLELMALGITQGQSVHIEANGADATAAVAALTDMLESATEQPSSSKETM